jgi:hypothetical protein
MRNQTDPVPVPPHVSGGEFTVGVEEELMLVDAAGGLLGASAAPSLSRCVARRRPAS